MASQGNNYLSTNLNISTTRLNGTNGLGDRTITSNTVNGVRYFSSLDAEICFGETYVDEVVQITWSMQQATMPIFGYNSYTFDDLAIGARQVNGTFVVNFTKSNFMYEVLKNLQSVNRSSLYTPDNLSDNGRLSWSSNFNKEHMPAWDRSFNIMVGYGDQKKNGVNTTMLILCCVQLTGCQQVMGLDGSPVGEAYSFIAKDIRYPDATSTSKSTSTTSSSTNTSSSSNSSSSSSASTSTSTLNDPFVFVVNNIEIVKKANSNSSSTPYTYTIKMSYTCNYDVLDVQITLKNTNNNAINAAALKLGNGGSNHSIEYAIPSMYASSINNKVISQNDTSMLYDLKIYYDINNVQQLPKFLSNKNVQIVEG
jgi:hypothetical protein